MKSNGGLGFQDLEDFNQALLAKQAWKLLNEPDSLLARVYEGMYFSSKSFLECGKGYRPSYAWRSINHGRELLVRGLLKSIGDGVKTKVWLEKWVMEEYPRRPINKQSLIDLELNVPSLLSPDGKWRVEVLHDLFPPDDVQQIVSMQVGRVDDRFIWAYTKQRAYLVKSGYWFVSNHPLIAPPLNSALEKCRIKLKEKIWKIKT